MFKVVCGSIGVACLTP
ncbi:DUF3265 domain-containing protein [Vibrio parahaemolyticus]|nr:DUF3265 domain-containing protein [Vibrio parahaemolyticus]